MGSIQKKIILFIVLAFGATCALVIGFSNYQLKLIIDNNQYALYLEKANSMETVISSAFEGLLDSGMAEVEGYVQDAQDEVLEILIKEHYNSESSADIYPYIFDQNGLIILHPVLKKGDSSLSDHQAVKQILKTKEGAIDYIYNGEEKWTVFKTFDGWQWTVGFTVSAKVKYAALSGYRNNLIAIIGLISLLFILILSAVISKRIISPIKMIADTARNLALGDIALSETSLGSLGKIAQHRDELGEIGRAFLKLISYQKDKVKVAEEIAKGNLNLDLEGVSEKDSLGLALQTMVNSLNRIVSQVCQVVEKVAASSLQVAEFSNSLSNRTAEQASSLQEITVSMVEIGKTTNTNAEHAIQANKFATIESEAASSGVEQMKQMMLAMEGIIYSSQEIAKIIKSIDEIAFQTNLLALNAAVEAARGISQVNQNLTHIDAITSQNTAHARETNTASAEFSDHAAEVKELLTYFSLKKRTSYPPQPILARRKDNFPSRNRLQENLKD